jgi:NAD(P)-dependent dehydrogenase (short-subunit alcohol dehydrogenase family)
MDPLKQFRLDGRVALVTGASSGIGAALSQALAATGARVALAARRTDRTEALALKIRSTGGEARPVLLDVTSAESIKRAFDEVDAAFGLPTIVVNSAGVGEAKTFLKTPRELLERTMGTNFFGMWDVCQEAAGRMVAAKRGGSIINVASILGLGAAVGYSSYSASKGAVVQLTRTLALEFVKHGIRVNALAPGWFVSEMNQEFFGSEAGQAYAKRIAPGRTGEMSELVGPLLLLASDAGSYVNGTVLTVDGGQHVTL